MTENTNGGKEPPSTNAADPDPNPVAEEEEDPVPSTSRGLVASVASGSGSSSSSSADRFRRRPYRRRKLRSEINASEGQEQDNHEDQTSEDDEDEEEVDGAKRSKVRRRNTTHSPPQYDLSALSVSSSSSASSSPSSASSSPSSSPLRSNGDEGDGQESIPRPAVLSKEPPKCPYNSVKDLIGREYRPRPRGWERKHHFLHNRMGSLEMVQRFELAYKLEQHEGCVNALSFNERGNLLASGSDDLDIIVWDWQNRRQKLSFPSGHNANVFQSKFLPLTGDTHLVSTSRDGQVRLAELSATGVGHSTRRLAQHKGPSNKIALLMDTPHTFLSGGEDCVVYSIDVRQPKAAHKLLINKKETGNKVKVHCVAADPTNDNLFCTAGGDPYLRIYDRRKVSKAESKPLKTFCPHHLMESQSRSFNITSAVYSHDGKDLIGSYNNEDIFLFQADHSDGANYRKRYQGHRNIATFKGVNFYGPRSEFVVSGSDCGNVFLWSKEKESIVHMFKGDDNGVVNVLEPHPNLPVLATSGLDNEVKIWYPTLKGQVPNVSEIEKTVMSNSCIREDHNPTGFEEINGERMLMLLRSIRRMEDRRLRARERQRGGGQDANGDTMASSANRDAGNDTDYTFEDSSDDQEGAAGDDDDDGDGSPLQCTTS